MTVTYFKRYRMEIRLHAGLFTALEPPVGYRLLAWHPDLLPAHAETKCRSFATEIDANVFPCLGELAGCQRLMHDIAAKVGFIPGATWLAARFASDLRRASEDGDSDDWGRSVRVSRHSLESADLTPEPCAYEYCGTVQGIADDRHCGGIQNLGVVPECRGLGLGRLLLLKALEGFWLAGLQGGALEVTAQNVAAVNLYRNLGFRRVKTVYKAVEVAYS